VGVKVWIPSPSHVEASRSVAPAVVSRDLLLLLLLLLLLSSSHLRFPPQEACHETCWANCFSSRCSSAPTEPGVVVVVVEEVVVVVEGVVVVEEVMAGGQAL